MSKTANIECDIICQTGSLTDEQVKQVKQLICRCQETDCTSLFYPFEEEDCHHYLLYEHAGGNFSTSDNTSTLCAVLAMIPCETEVECSAFTRPDRRRNGYFTALLETALETFEEYDILFPVTGNCPDTLATLEALDAEVESQELMMELELDEWSNGYADVTGYVLTESDMLESEDDFCDIPTDDGRTWELRSADSSGFADSSSAAGGASILLGTCQTTSVSDTCVCLHHVEILPQFRQKGYGTILLTRLLSALKESGTERVILQVSGGNEAALALYKKQGFRITETLSYYLY